MDEPVGKFKALYNQAASFEQGLFFVAPLPVLQPIKAGIQHAAIPIGVGLALTHAPIVAPAASFAIGAVQNMMQNGAHHAAEYLLGQYGQAMSDIIPNQLGMQSGFDLIHNASTGLVLKAQDFATSAVGQAAGVYMLGRTTVNAGVLLGEQMVNKAIQSFESVRNLTVQEVLGAAKVAGERIAHGIGGMIHQLKEIAQKIEQHVVDSIESIGNKAHETINQVQGNAPEPAPAISVTTIHSSVNTESPVNGQGQSQQVESTITESHLDNNSQDNSMANNRSQNAPEPAPIITPKSVAEEKKNSQKVQNVAEDGSEFILRNIKDYLDRNNFKTDNMSVSINGEAIFKMRNGEVDSNIDASSEQLALLTKALKDYPSFDGEIELIVDGKTLLHVKDGVLINNTLGLAEKSAQVEVRSETPTSPSELLWKQYSKDLNPDDISSLNLVANDAISQGVAPDQVAAMLRHAPSIQTYEAKHGEDKANSMVNAYVNDAVNSQIPDQKQHEQQQQQSIAMSQ